MVYIAVLELALNKAKVKLPFLSAPFLSGFCGFSKFWCVLINDIVTCSVIKDILSSVGSKSRNVFSFISIFLFSICNDFWWFYNLRVASCDLQVVSCNFKKINLRVASCFLRVSSCFLRVVNLRK